MKIFKIFVVVMFMLGSVFAQEPVKLMPDFSFIDTERVIFRKANLKENRKSLIVFFDATCSHCQKAGTFFNSHLKDLKPYNVLFVTMDENKSIDLFMNGYAPQIPEDKNVKVLRDTNYYFVPNFLPKSYPAIYVYDSTKKITFYTDGDKELDKVLITLKSN